MKSKTKTILITLLSLIALFFLYRFFFVSEPVEDLAVQSGSGEEGDVILLLNRLRSIDLDTEVLTSEAIQNLEDYGVTLEMQPIGRLNPFAPIGVGGVPQDESDSDTTSVNEATEEETSGDELDELETLLTGEGEE